MDRLSKCLQYYITDRLNNDAGWKGIKVCKKNGGRGIFREDFYVNRKYIVA